MEISFHKKFRIAPNSEHAKAIFMPFKKNGKVGDYRLVGVEFTI